MSAIAQAEGDATDFVCCVLGDLLASELWIKAVGVGPGFAKVGAMARVEQVLEVVGVDGLVRAGEVGVDLNALDVADYEEGWVAEVVTVEQELAVGVAEVAAWGLVLPGEGIALPHVGEAAAAGCLLHVAFERVVFAGWVGFDWCRDVEEAAEVVEVRLR